MGRSIIPFELHRVGGAKGLLGHRPGTDKLHAISETLVSLVQVSRPSFWFAVSRGRRVQFGTESRASRAQRRAWNVPTAAGLSQGTRNASATLGGLDG